MANKLDFETSGATGNSAKSTGGSLLNSMRTGVMSRNGGGDLLGNYTRVLRTILEREANPVVSQMRVTQIEGASAGVSMSSVILTHTEEGKTWAYIYLLEGTNQGLGTRELKQSTFHGGYQQVNMPYVAADLYKTSYVQRAFAILAQTLNVPVASIVDAGCLVIHKEASPMPRDNESELTDFVGMVWAGVNAIAFRINLLNPQRDEWTVKDLNGKRINAKLSFMNSAIFDEVGMPKRAGYEIVTYGSIQGGEDVALSTATPLSQVTGYVDLLQLTEQGAAEAFQQQMATGGFNMLSQFMGGTPVVPRFAARVVCTYAQTNTDVMSLGILMFALFSNAILMGQQALWRQQFNNRYNDQTHSLSGLSLELGAQVDPTDAQFSLSQFLSANVIKAPIFTLHVSPVGPSAHLWSLLVSACGDGPDAAKVKELIIATINKATGGIFAQNFNSQERIGFVEDRIVPAGYFKDGNNQMQDIRSLDKLAVGNMSNDIVVIQNFEDARNPESQVPKEKRFLDELSIISECLAGNYRLTGMDMAITFNPNFIIAGYNAYHTAMGGVRLENSHEQIDQEVRGASGYSAYMINGATLNRPGMQFGSAQSSLFTNNLRNAFTM
jgi:hypothetical protein